MAKGIYINTGEDVEVINFKKVDDVIVNYNTERLSDKLTIYFNEDDTDDVITINDMEYGLPALIKIKGKTNNYFIDALIRTLEDFETDEIYLYEDDFYEEYDEYDDDYSYENDY